ncbi:arylamine N-acetyltransferase family protein [Brachybacterium sacelli]|uniref:N-hydroxyarylamine O-acetyltransferase n=1 Tax=Brachybacterium sacelli TaxID=173364 RepID=A0ABS4X1F4_9MICO|nr:arylamine N-acetyltransferase [Brachybacterium sacelli]MBP2381564.1 N-hydroxyarylamine O-acetyltransferase [Brachybacterium sacelli]
MSPAAPTGESDWGIEAFDPALYLDRIGVAPNPPGALDLDLLERIHLAHVRTFPFSNVDVLLGRHPGVDPGIVATRMLHEGVGGYCFEHAQLMAGVLERLGMTVRRCLGRVHSPTNTRTHMTLDAELEGRWWVMDPGFGLSLTGPLPREDGARREEWFGTLSMHRRGTGDVQQWELRRGEDVQHVTDLLPVVPADVRSGHHITSTMPGAGPFRTMLILSRFTDGGHVTVTSAARTVRRPGQRTVHEELDPAQVLDAVADLGLPMDAATARALGERLRETA